MRYTILIFIQIISFTLIGQTINMPTVPENGVSYNFDQLENNSEPTSYSDKGPMGFLICKDYFQVRNETFTY